jgi:retron-type reverse transcriptase
MDLKDIKNINMLSQFLGTDQDFFELFLSKPQIISSSKDSSDFINNSSYFRIQLRKRKGNGYRIVYKVRNNTVLNVQKKLQSYLNKIYNAPDFVHGFIHGKDIKSNAFPHITKKIILKTDIHNFFESIGINQVINVFKELGCSEEISKALSKLVTLEDKLVQGFVTSPIISNLAVISMDNKLKDFCDKNNFDYTRYADDITFSSNKEIPNINIIEEIIKENGFSINKDKTLTMFRGKRQYVTGLTVFDDKYPRVSKRFKRNLRLQVHYLKTYGITDVALHLSGFSFRDYEKDSSVVSEVNSEGMIYFNNLKGKVDFVNSIEPELAQKMYKDINLGLGHNDYLSSILK